MFQRKIVGLEVLVHVRDQYGYISRDSYVEFHRLI